MLPNKPPSPQVMRFLVVSGVDVTGDVGDVVMQTAAAWAAKDEPTLWFMN